MIPYDPLFIIVISVLVIGIGISKSGIAGGVTTLGVPVLSLFVSPFVAAGILLPIMAVIDTTVIWNYRHQYQKKYLLLFIPGGLLGITIGYLANDTLDPAWIRIFVAFTALAFAFMHFGRNFLPAAKNKLGLKWGVFFSTIAGVTSHIAHAGGPPLRGYLLSQGLTKSQFVGTFGFFFGLVNWVKIVPYLMAGQITWESFMLSLYLMPLVPIGVWAGLKLHKRLSQQMFMTLSYSLLIFAGIKLGFDGILELTSRGL